jgi:pimeloyl-ACP methyl ester carboxylesterase
MTRAAVLLPLLLPGPAFADSFVLVHGAFAGEWAWDAVVPLLEAEGHDAVAVSLKGQGARAGENDPSISPEDHVQDIVEAIEAATPPVILVAHSYGGRPATGAWDRARDRLAHLVWVEAPAPLTDTGIPADGESLAFVVTMYPDAASAGLLSPPPVRTGTYPQPLTPMSIKALYGPVPIEGGPLPPIPGTFVAAEDSSLPVLRRLGEEMEERRNWTLRSVPGGHDVPFDAPEALAAVLLEIAQATE